MFGLPTTRARSGCRHGCDGTFQAVHLSDALGAPIGLIPGPLDLPLTNRHPRTECDVDLAFVCGPEMRLADEIRRQVDAIGMALGAS